ncbi:phage tail assembly protein [Phytopseudomonas daroniae]|uniref:phage tail assembly protein n=1 Tax=Phytopseudomonas daroniae TaxID=2487519 RepID=UPI00103830A7|nr:phage tail assembly protein [Pseudomonas daroniae]TBU78172.1 phage tail assembly protein [Pseudomonas daroniae]
MATPEKTPTPKISEAEAAPAKNPNEEIVELDTPIVRGETTITTVTLRKPMAGELRGVALADLAQVDVLALRKVLPRITTPALTDHEIGRLDPADLLDLGVKVANFLLKKAQRAEINASLTA